jgi:hypothetical protein
MPLSLQALQRVQRAGQPKVAGSLLHSAKRFTVRFGA